MAPASRRISTPASSIAGLGSALLRYLNLLFTSRNRHIVDYTNGQRLSNVPRSTMALTILLACPAARLQAVVAQTEWPLGILSEQLVRYATTT